MRTSIGALALAIATAAGIFLTVGTVTRTDAAAIVGKPRALPAPKVAERSDALEQLKAAYRRPMTIPFPRDNPYSRAKALLGKKLFFDTRLSATNLMSCATCHNPAFGWADGGAGVSAPGENGLRRRSPTIVNAAWSRNLTWDGHADTLEAQALGPIAAKAEMNLPLDRLIDRLQAIDEYRDAFGAAFPDAGVTTANVAKALATYERTVVSGWAPFDAWIGGDEAAITAAAKRGFSLFNGKAGCAQCHGGWNFADASFHDIGLPDGDLGRGRLHPGIDKLQHAFKTPSLREVGRRVAYMHDGSLTSLEAVIEHYDHGGVSRPSRSSLIEPLALTAQDKSDLIAFLQSLTGHGEPTTIPSLPRRVSNGDPAGIRAR